MDIKICNNCSNIVLSIVEEKDIICCDECMSSYELTTYDRDENHKIQIRKIGNFVTIYIKDHPMIDVHHLTFFLVQTNKGFLYRELQREEEPKIEIILSDEEEIITIYAHCNTHMLIKQDYS